MKLGQTGEHYFEDAQWDDNGTPRELGSQDYDGRCRYTFENVDVPSNEDVIGNLDNQSSCGVSCNNGQCDPTVTTTINLYPDCL